MWSQERLEAFLDTVCSRQKTSYLAWIPTVVMDKNIFVVTVRCKCKRTEESKILCCSTFNVDELDDAHVKFMGNYLDKTGKMLRNFEYGLVPHSVDFSIKRRIREARERMSEFRQEMSSSRNYQVDYKTADDILKQGQNKFNMLLFVKTRDNTEVAKTMFEMDRNDNSHVDFLDNYLSALEKWYFKEEGADRESGDECDTE